MATTTLIPPPADGPVQLPYASWHHRVLPGGGLVSDITIDGTVEIRLAGEIDVHDRFALFDVLTAVALQSGARHVHVVADELDFVDLRILQLVAQVRSELRQDSGELIVTGLRGVYATAWNYVTAMAPTHVAPATRQSDIELATARTELADGIDIDAYADIRTLVPA